MKKIILKCFLIITCILLLTSFASASVLQSTRFSDFKYIDTGEPMDCPVTDFYITEDEEEIQQLIKESNIDVPNNSKVIRIGICTVKERETKINRTENAYLKNVTKNGKGYFKNEFYEQTFSNSKITNAQNRTAKPYLRNSQIFDVIISGNIISEKKSLQIDTEYEYDSKGEHVKMVSRDRYSSGGYEKQKTGYVSGEAYAPKGIGYSLDESQVMLTVWDLYSYVTFESYNIFKNEWEPGELYIPEGFIYMAVEYENN